MQDRPPGAGSEKPLFFDVTLGMMSWRAAGTLGLTLDNYADAQILDLFAARRIHFNEISQADRALALRYGFEVTGSEANLGIFGGLCQLAAATGTKYLLSVENDCPLVTDHAGFVAMLGSALDDMKREDIAVFSMRSRREPGEKFARRERYERKFRVVWPIGSEPCARRPSPGPLVRAAEDWRRSSLRGCAIYAEEDPTLRHPGIIRRSANGHWLTTSAYLNWTNNCLLVRTDFLRDIVLERVRTHPAAATLNGHQDVEAALKEGRWWRDLDVAMGQCEPGPFTHKKLG